MADTDQAHPLTPDHLPAFVVVPGTTDWLMLVSFGILFGAVLSVGLIYLRLHALPEHLAHRGQKVQFQIVAVLGLLALFTHNHVFWIAALLLALVEVPDFGGPLGSIARSLDRIAARDGPPSQAPAPPTAARGPGEA